MNSWIKKGFCLVVLVSILLTCAGALAEEQIITKLPELFSGDTNFEIMTDDFENRTIIKPSQSVTLAALGDRDWASKAISAGQFKATLAALPLIVISNSKPEHPLPVLHLSIIYTNSDWVFADEAIIMIGENTYQFSPADPNRSNGDGMIRELLTIKLAAIDERHSDFIDDWIAHSSEDDVIKIRLKGSKGNVDFEFTSKTKEIVSTALERYKDAGGFDALDAYEQYLNDLGNNLGS